VIEDDERLGDDEELYESIFHLNDVSTSSEHSVDQSDFDSVFHSSSSDDDDVSIVAVIQLDTQKLNLF
jgi:hypothetical protein